MRQTGIEVVGEAPWGTHFCQFYATKDDLRDILVPYFKAGLEANEFCIWVTSAPLGVREAWDALAKAVPDLESYRRRGRIEIIPHTEWYLLGGSFEQDRVLEGWVAKLEDALARGCAGLRLTGNTFWLEKANWQSFAEYEAAVDGVLGQHRMLALCTYALDRCGASEVADVVRNHQFALIKRDGRWELFESFDRRRMQDALEMERERNRLLFQNMLDGFAYCRMLFDERGRPEDFVHLDVNAAFGRLTGLRDVVGKRVSEVIPGLRESQPELLETYGRVATTGHAERFEVEIRPLGIWLSIAVYSPHPDHFVAVFDNITERKRGEQALRESEERYRTLFTSMTEGFTLSRALHDQAGRLVDFVVMDANRAAERFNGLEREKLIGKTWRELWPGAEQYWWNICDDVLREGRDVRYENYARIHDRWYEVHQFRVAKGLMGTIFTDITGRKRAEDSVRAANARLTEADRRKNEFLGMLSHELRNPLAPIRNSIYILDHAAATGDQAARAKAVIKRQAEHLTRLVDDLLDVTRIARGKIEVKPSRLDLALLVRRVGEDHVALMRQSGIEFTVDVPGEPMWADGDPTRLAQVIGNLLHNSAKFTARGGLVTLALEPVRGAAEIHVRDTGVGMEPELLMHVFEPFVQAQRTLARTDGGLGLGLALVKGIAELHGGSARAASAGPGQGAEFVVRLPLVEAGASDPAALPRAVRTAGSRRVLVVDDNEDAAESLAQLVELFGHTAEVAYDGPSAMAKARANPPDVIFCDIGLPGMSGYELVRALRSDEALRRTQVFAVSGYAQPEDRKKAADAGFDGHVAKPSDPDQIERLLA